MADALRRTVPSPGTAFALFADAKDSDAVAFYQHHGFRPVFGRERMLFLSIEAAEKTLTSEKECQTESKDGYSTDTATGPPIRDFLPDRGRIFPRRG